MIYVYGQRIRKISHTFVTIELIDRKDLVSLSHVPRWRIAVKQDRCLLSRSHQEPLVDSRLCLYNF